MACFRWLIFSFWLAANEIVTPETVMARIPNQNEIFFIVLLLPKINKPTNPKNRIKAARLNIAQESAGNEFIIELRQRIKNGWGRASISVTTYWLAKLRLNSISGF